MSNRTKLALRSEPIVVVRPSLQPSGIYLQRVIALGASATLPLGNNLFEVFIAGHFPLHRNVLRQSRTGQDPCQQNNAILQGVATCHAVGKMRLCGGLNRITT